MISTILRTRLLALLELHGYSITGIAKAMGRSHTWLLRKLDPEQAATRPLTVSDLDEVLAHLGLEPDVLLMPVLLPGDRELLAFVGSAGSTAFGGGVTVDQVSAVFAQADVALSRLSDQGLLTRPTDHPDHFQITISGALAL